MPATVVALNGSPVMLAAQAEMLRGVRGMLGRTLRAAAAMPEGDAIVLGDIASVRRVLPQLPAQGGLIPDGFWLKAAAFGGHNVLVVTGLNDRGVLYGVFALLRKMSLDERIDQIGRAHV